MTLCKYCKKMQKNNNKQTSATNKHQLKTTSIRSRRKPIFLNVIVMMEDLSRRKRSVVEVKAKMAKRIEATTPTSIQEKLNYTSESVKV